MSKKKSGPSPIAVVSIVAVSAIALGVLTTTVMRNPNQAKPAEETTPPVTQQNPLNIETEAPKPKIEEVTVLVPTYTGGEFGTQPKSVKVPEGQDAMVFAVNSYMDQLSNVPKEVRVRKVSVKDAVATLDFGPDIYQASFGSEDEQIFVRGILRTMSQFDGVRFVLFSDGEAALDSFGHLDVSTPQKVEPIQGSTESRPQPADPNATAQ